MMIAEVLDYYDGHIRVLNGAGKLYDSTESPDFPFDLMFARFISMRVGSDGVLEFTIPD